MKGNESERAEAVNSCYVMLQIPSSHLKLESQVKAVKLQDQTRLND